MYRGPQGPQGTRRGSGGQRLRRNALIAALTQLDKQHETALAHQQAPVPASSFWDTHPPTANRIAKIRTALANT